MCFKRSVRPSHVLRFVGLAGLSACAMGTSDEEMETGFVLVAPTLESIQPDQVVLGDDIKIFGENFIPKEHGVMGLHLEGLYLDSDGREHSFSREVPLEVLNDAVAELRFEELFFHPTGDRIGTWRGTATLVNRTTDDELWSDEHEETIRVGPSIRLDRLRSADAGTCDSVTSGTNSGHNIELGFQVIGLGEATPGSPWDVRISFVAPDVEVRYVAPNSFSTWPIDLTSAVVTPGEPGYQRMETTMESGDTVVLDPSTTARTLKINPPVTIGQEVHEEVVLGMLRAGDVEFGGMKAASFLIEVTTPSGTLRRQADFEIWSEFEIGFWNGTERLAERYDPQATSGCTPGQKIGRDLRYSEREAEKRGRKVEVLWATEVEQKLGAKHGIQTIWASATAEGKLSWTSKFGISVEEAVTSVNQSGQALSVFVLPGHYGMSYRQLERLERTVGVVYHNECGASGWVADAVLTNWNFGFDVAQDLGCPPTTTLPPAEVF